MPGVPGWRGGKRAAGGTSFPPWLLRASARNAVRSLPGVSLLPGCLPPGSGQLLGWGWNSTMVPPARTVVHPRSRTGGWVPRDSGPASWERAQRGDGCGSWGGADTWARIWGTLAQEPRWVGPGRALAWEEGGPPEEETRERRRGPGGSGVCPRCPSHMAREGRHAAHSHMLPGWCCNPAQAPGSWGPRVQPCPPPAPRFFLACCSLLNTWAPAMPRVQPIACSQVWDLLFVPNNVIWAKPSGMRPRPGMGSCGRGRGVCVCVHIFGVSSFLGNTP